MINEVMEELKALGTEQNRKIYKRHGIHDDMYGVSFGNLKTLKKKLKKNHDLALELWETGNHDARILATMIADPKKADSETLDRWAQDFGNYTIADLASGFIGQTPLAQQKAEQWMDSDNEWMSTAGWNLLAGLALNDPSIPDSYFEPYLEQIEREIHTRKNRVRYAMNNAVISIGTRNPHLKQKAIDAAALIGVVEVDHGETNCETPDACSYIEKVWARKK